MGITQVIKNYRELGAKGFRDKFMEGVNGITQLQQSKIQQRSTWISMFGVICGIVVCAWQIKTMWWVLIILLGGAGITLVQLIAGSQKIKILLDIENTMKEVI